MKLDGYGRQNRELIRAALQDAPPKPKRERASKFGSRKADQDGIRFDSEKERARYRDLAIMAAGGAIQDLQLQVCFSLDVGEVHVCSYVADFVYWTNGLRIVEDVKGHRTAVYKLKRKLMMAVHGIEIREI